MTSCLSSMRSEPTELTTLFPFEKARIRIHGNLGNRFFGGVVELWLKIKTSRLFIF